MKRLFFIFTIIGASVFSGSYAADAGTSPAVVRAFQMDYFGAKEIVWEQVGVLSKATFELDGQYQSVFYSSDGDQVAVTQNLASTNLPKALRASLKKELQGRWITNLFKVSIEGEDTYYVTLENADTQLMLQSTGAKKWTVYQKHDK